jgi:cell fate regulator YaaT (PSP1 superfamily)
MGEVQAILENVSPEELKTPLRPVLRKATPTDVSRRLAIIQREHDARDFCRERISARGLPMKLTEVRIGLDSSKAMFYFTSDGRVDFRELVKDLVQHLRTRVELRQIGVRDEAKVLGCAGACGRPVCCHSFLPSFAPVSIRMAKDQNLALNPSKLSGICGRLKCCLAYEHCLYSDLKRALPKVGSHVTTSRGAGVIRGQNILEQSVLVNLETGGQVTLRMSEVNARLRSDAAGRAEDAGQTSAPRAGETPPAGKPVAKGSERGRGRRPRRQSAPRNTQPAGGEEIPRDLAALEDP